MKTRISIRRCEIHLLGCPCSPFHSAELHLLRSCLGPGERQEIAKGLRVPQNAEQLGGTWSEEEQGGAGRRLCPAEGAPGAMWSAAVRPPAMKAPPPKSLTRRGGLQPGPEQPVLIRGQTWHLRGYFCLKTGRRFPSACLKSPVLSLSRYCPFWNHSHRRWRRGG